METNFETWINESDLSTSRLKPGMVECLKKAKSLVERGVPVENARNLARLRLEQWAGLRGIMLDAAKDDAAINAALSRILS